MTRECMQLSGRRPTRTWAPRRPRLAPARAARAVKACARSSGNLAGATVGVVGCGASGRSAVQLALQLGATRVLAFDSNESLVPLEQDPSLRIEPALRGRVSTQLGRHEAALLRQADVLVVSPGVPLTAPGLDEALPCIESVYSEVGFAWAHFPGGLGWRAHRGTTAVAITGTNGKSTVTSYTAQLLEACGISTWAGGNLGSPLSDLALQLLQAEEGGTAAGAPTAVVLELSSFQLELPGPIAPDVAALTNLTPDHLERHGSMESYARTKAALFARMCPGSTAVLPSGDALVADAFKHSGSAATVVEFFDVLHEAQARAQDAPDIAASKSMVWTDTAEGAARLRLPHISTAAARVDVSHKLMPVTGNHNFANAAMALALAVAARPEIAEDPAVLGRAVAKLATPPHRCEVVLKEGARTGRDLTWINDSKATNVESTLAGLRGLEGTYNAIVLLGGCAKREPGGGLGMARLLHALKQHAGVVVFGRDGGEMARELKAAGAALEVWRADKLRGACEAGRNMARELGADAVVLSPAAASFDEFRGYAHRGEEFRRIAHSYAEGARGFG